MIALSGSPRIFVCLKPTDVRKSFEGLSFLAQTEFNLEATSGAYFVFLNKRRDRMKVLYWDGDGFAIWYKHLQKGSFTTKLLSDSELDRRQFFLLLEGVTPKRLQSRFKLS